MTYPQCADCDRPMRHPRKKLADHPGTVQARSNGRCWTCAKTDTTEDTPDVLAARIALHGFINQRRRRGIPENGIQEEEAA